MMKSINDFMRQYQENLLLSNITNQMPSEISSDYEIYACLKESSDKSVYIIQSKSTNKLFLLKVSPQSRKELLWNEFHIYQTFLKDNCTNIPQVYGFYEANDLCFLLEEYIYGDTLYDLKESGFTFTTDSIVQIMIRLCNVLSPLHHLTPPVIHRDLTPKNIMMTKEGKLYLIDFETVREFSEKKDSDTVCMGTAAYCPPEQFGYQQTDVRSDIYSLGMVFFYLVTKECNITTIDDYKLPKHLKRIIKKCTAFSPAQRYQNIDSLLTALKQLTPEHKLLKKQIQLFASNIAVIILGTLLVFSYITKKPTNSLTPTDSSTTDLNEVIAFHDSTIEQAVRNYLNVDSSATITRKDLLQITSLRICGTTILNPEDEYVFYTESRINQEMIEETGTIHDLTDLSYMTNLYELVLANEHISDLSPLASLPLHILYVPCNQIVDLSVLEQLDDLEELMIGSNPIRDLSILSNLRQDNHLSNLSFLDIACLNLYSLDFLNDLALTSLNIEGVNLHNDNFEPLLTQSNLRHLRTCNLTAEELAFVPATGTMRVLELFSCQATSLNSLPALEKLEELHLHGSVLQTLEGIEQYPSLNFLSISETNITDLSPLFKLQHLNYVDITGSPIQDPTQLEQIIH